MRQIDTILKAAHRVRETISETAELAVLALAALVLEESDL